MLRRGGSGPGSRAGRPKWTPALMIAVAVPRESSAGGGARRKPAGPDRVPKSRLAAAGSDGHREMATTASGPLPPPCRPSLGEARMEAAGASIDLEARFQGLSFSHIQRIRIRAS